FLVFSKPTTATYVDFTVSGSGSVRTITYPNTSTCAWQSTVFVCTGDYLAPSISVSVSVNVANVAMGLRTWDASKVTCSAVDDVGAGNPETSVTCSATVALQSDGSAIITVVTGAMPDIVGSGWGSWANYKIKIDRAAFGDHALLSTTDPGTCPSYGCTGWFVRNEWYRLVYYAVPTSNTAARVASERSCTTYNDCLTVTNATASTDATTPTALLLLLAGRSVNANTRPSGTPSDYLESGNATGAYVKNPVNTSSTVTAQRFNDRVAAFRSN
ncbi:MAG: hypothetical protein ACREXT_18810, partial [Gammaproteobacteria bacterium]